MDPGGGRHQYDDHRKAELGGPMGGQLRGVQCRVRTVRQRPLVARARRQPAL